MKKYIYAFGGGTAEGDGTMRDTLGGKGAGLAEMSRAGVPVPPGFTIATDVCNLYFAAGNRTPGGVEKEMKKAVAALEKENGQKLGDPRNPLLVSVRSGAKFSMPGMMDTILNLGLNDKTTAGLARKSDNAWFAFDCFRRFIQMFGNVVLGIDKEEFEHILRVSRERSERSSIPTLSLPTCNSSSPNTKSSSRGKPRKPSPRIPIVSSRWRATPSSARGLTRGRTTTGV